MIMSDGMSELIEELKKTYDYIIWIRHQWDWFLMLELAQYSDVTLYIVRQNFSKGNDYFVK
jgi:hypothetical protein